MHMFHRRRRLAASSLAVGLLAATLFTVDSVTFPSPAEARCVGEGNPVTSWFGAGPRGSETPGAGTCNGNNIYSGVLKDERADGYCISVWFNDGGQGWRLPSTGNGRVCGSGNTSSFQWEDFNGNNQAYQQFCIDKASTLTDEPICGWGSQVGDQYYALNSGY
jgi:hypothetical protein